MVSSSSPHDLRVILALLVVSPCSTKEPFIGLCPPTVSNFCYTQKHNPTNKKSTEISLDTLLVAGAGFEPHDLRVMSPMSYQAALPRDKALSCRPVCIGFLMLVYDTSCKRFCQGFLSNNWMFFAQNLPIVVKSL